ncbi:hypothetical protein MHK_002940 [Candidatus Magnetomorum sp. HK-1]|nr:hypothetical protein MHK_002940 [Candidatus Magnetomorum sp. HK-1]
MEVVKHYSEQNKKLSYSKLENIFPPSLQGANGVFHILEEADTKHFDKPHERITLSDSVVVVSQRWGPKNINAFIEHAISLGYDIKALNG